MVRPTEYDLGQIMVILFILGIYVAAWGLIELGLYLSRKRLNAYIKKY